MSAASINDTNRFLRARVAGVVYNGSKWHRSCTLDWPSSVSYWDIMGNVSELQYWKHGNFLSYCFYWYSQRIHVKRELSMFMPYMAIDETQIMIQDWEEIIFKMSSGTWQWKRRWYWQSIFWIRYPFLTSMSSFSSLNSSPFPQNMTQI